MYLILLQDKVQPGSCVILNTNISSFNYLFCFRSKQKIDEELLNQRKALFQASVEAESDAYYTSSRLLDDGIIDPRDTRNVLGFCLSVVYSNNVEGGNLHGVSRI